jgi:hypothetical protein
MDRAEIAVRNMLSAIEAPLYDIGVLGERGMLPRLAGISAAEVLDRLPLIKYRNLRSCHIYIRPSGEHRFTVLDDLDEAALARLSEDGFAPCAVVGTSAGNFQAWLKHSTVLPKLVGTLAAQTLASRYNAELLDAMLPEVRLGMGGDQLRLSVPEVFEDLENEVALATRQVE